MDIRLFQIVEKTVNLIQLNIIWVLCSLPLVTAGAALCALHVTAVRILEGEEGYVFRDFWRVYRSKMRLSLKLWLPLLAAAFALGFDYMFWREVEGNLAESMRVLICALSGMWIALVIYVFPLAARMETDAGVTCRNGLLLLFKYLPQSVYLLFISGVFLAAALLWTLVFAAGVLAGGSLLALVHGKMLMWIFGKEKIEIS